MILDTNGVSAMADGNPGIEALLRAAPALAIPVIVLGEFRYGAAQSGYLRRYEECLNALL